MPLTEELHRTLTMVLAGGQGNRLQPLTSERAKPAVPFAGLFRILDFTLTNCIHSGLRRVYVLTQYRSRSLDEHLRFGWAFLPRRLGQFISGRPPQFAGTASWYRGTADAIWQNIEALDEERPDRVLILSGDHIYRMDYGRMLRQHIESGAALTIAAIPVPVEEGSRFGVFEADERGLAVSFQEKPEHPREIPGRPGWCLASMGIYLFDADELRRRLREDAENPESSHDFGKDIIPRMIAESSVHVHHFTSVADSPNPYWRDIGTLDSYYEANMDLCSALPQFNLYDHRWSIYTRQFAEPPAKVVHGDASAEEGRRTEVLDSLLCPGVVVSKAQVMRSILSYRVRIDEQAVVENSLLFSGVTVGAGAQIRRAIIDKWVEVPPGEKIGHDLEVDRKRFTVTESGIVVVPRNYEFPGSAKRSS